MRNRILPIGFVVLLALGFGMLVVWTAIFNQAPHGHSAFEQEMHEAERLKKEKAEAAQAERDVDEINKGKQEFFQKPPALSSEAFSLHKKSPGVICDAGGP